MTNLYLLYIFQYLKLFKNNIFNVFLQQWFSVVSRIRSIKGMKYAIFEANEKSELISEKLKKTKLMKKF